MTEQKPPYKISQEQYETEAAANLRMITRQGQVVARIAKVMDEYELSHNERLLVIAGLLARLLRPLVKDEAKEANGGGEANQK